jgi:CDP-paratose 2-epimerase
MDGSNGRDRGHTLVTGGVGFIGTNVVHRLVKSGESVVVLDNFSREGVEQNARWLSSVLGERLKIVRGDTRDRALVLELMRGARQVFHFAAQVAVTSSLLDPLEDFEVNAHGTLNVLEAIRRQPEPPSLLYTSTNKVYGALPTLELSRQPTRYVPADPKIAAQGVNEQFDLDFHSPYGCSKGAADQYVIDYARSYGIPALVFRRCCIYGPHQCGNEDQGWVAHFLKQALARRPITLYGDGLQVRDVLFVDDLVEAMMRAQANATRLAGQAFNIGGGPTNTTSLVELLERIGALTGEVPEVRFEPTRVGDQRYYVSDVSRFTRATGWQPSVDVATGVSALLSWLSTALKTSDQHSDQVVASKAQRRAGSRVPQTNEPEPRVPANSEAI